MIVTADNKVEARTIKLGQAIEDKWTVTDGLKAGDTVIVEGLQKIKPGMDVKTVPFNWIVIINKKRELSPIFTNLRKTYVV